MAKDLSAMTNKQLSKYIKKLNRKINLAYVEQHRRRAVSELNFSFLERARERFRQYD